MLVTAPFSILLVETDPLAKSTFTIVPSAIFPEVIEPLRMFTLVIAPLANFTEVMAPFLMSLDFI
jgi:hypothetical protein